MTRWLKAHFPLSSISVCDLDKDGVDFCSKTFDAIPVYSEEDVSKIPINDKFDLIWCGSLLTHFKSEDWFSFLNFFNSLLSKGGILIFTVHGRGVVHYMENGNTYGLAQEDIAKILDQYHQSGFGYADYDWQKNYGISIISKQSVLSYLERIPDFSLLTYIEKGWDNHQDVVGCMKL